MRLMGIDRNGRAVRVKSFEHMQGITTTKDPQFWNPVITRIS
jgi:hypothetical protein